MTTPKMFPARRVLPLVLAGFAACLLLSGCGRGRPRYFEHDNVGDEVSGKINLDRVTLVAPRLQVGDEQVRLNTENIEKYLGKIKDKEYGSFRVAAFINFDEYKVMLFESQLFEKGKNEPTARDIRAIRAELKRALKVYRSI